MTYENHPQSSYRRGAGSKLYRDLIMELIGCKEDETKGVERVMRDKWGTLDNLDRAEFRREAKKAYQILKILWNDVYL